MTPDKIVDIISYTLPAVITGSVAYYFFKQHVANEDSRRKYLLFKETNKEILPLKLQAYERMTLFLERIEPSKLLIRVSPHSSDKHAYEELLIRNIEQEFEHNLTQQIYISEKCWTIINTSKNSLIQTIRKVNMSDKVDTANKLREVILTDLLDKPSPTSIALAYIKTEVQEMLTY